ENPMTVRGKLQGGVVQGLGQALLEHQVYDRQSGQLVSGSFMDYGMPRADTMPNVETELEEVPCKTNPLGVKGIGESGTIGAPPTIINAVIDALSPLGVDRIEMPATPLRVWQAISRARGAAAARPAEPREEARLLATRLLRWACIGASVRRRERTAERQHGDARGFEPRKPSHAARLQPKRKRISRLEIPTERLERG